MEFSQYTTQPSIFITKKKAKMKFKLLTLSLLYVFTLTAQSRSELVKSYSVNSGGETYKVIELSRKNKRINAKYFAHELYKKSISKRYDEFNRSHKVVLYTSGTYMTNHQSVNAKPVGLTIDNGNIVNGALTNMDGLVIVYATGGVVVSNLEEKNLSYNGLKNQDLYNGMHINSFKSWAQSNRATVFQTHLLAWENKLQFAKSKAEYAKTDAGRQKRERRFLAICYKNKGLPNQEVLHCIVHKGDKSNGENLYDATEKVLNFLMRRKRYYVQAILNLDPGSQDVFQYFNEDGSEDPFIKGTVSRTNARNLLIYHYE